MSRGEESGLEYVHFLSLSNPAHGGWSLTAAVTFYEAPARFSHCVFADNECEDALNTIRSRVSIEECVFRHTQADAFDSDFSNGKIAKTLFVDCGNDAIDVSGSVFEVADCRIEGTGDKGVSSGENSQVVVRNLELVRAAIAVASKDLSELRGEKIRIIDSQVGMTIFQKKPEFGPASMVVDQLEMTGVHVPYLVEKNSKLTLNGKRIQPNQEKVRDELYGVRYGKASR
jgi:parallel beta helix pectate lyase-like protein